jgi:hypothetical protein
MIHRLGNCWPRTPSHERRPDFASSEKTRERESVWVTGHPKSGGYSMLRERLGVRLRFEMLAERMAPLVFPEPAPYLTYLSNILT